MKVAGWEFDRWSDPTCRSSLAKKMIILRLKSGGMGLFNDLFVSVVNWLVLCHYILDGALHVAGS